MLTDRVSGSGTSMNDLLVNVCMCECILMGCVCAVYIHVKMSTCQAAFCSTHHS